MKKTVSPHNKQHSDEKVDEGLQLVLITWANVSQLTMEGGEEKSLDQQTELDHQMDFQDHVVAPPRREDAVRRQGKMLRPSVRVLHCPCVELHAVWLMFVGLLDRRCRTPSPAGGF